MTTKLFSAALALATLTAATTAFAADNDGLFRRNNSYKAPDTYRAPDSYRAPDTYRAPVTRPEPRYQPTDYRPTYGDKSKDDSKPVYRPRRDSYGN